MQLSGQLPDSWQDMEALQTLDLGSNPQLKGWIPPSWSRYVPAGSHSEIAEGCYQPTIQEPVMKLHQRKTSLIWQGCLTDSQPVAHTGMHAGSSLAPPTCALSCPSSGCTLTAQPSCPCQSSLSSHSQTEAQFRPCMQAEPQQLQRHTHARLRQPVLCGAVHRLRDPVTDSNHPRQPHPPAAQPSQQTPTCSELAAGGRARCRQH